MFLATARLPHLLKPAAYCSAEAHALEQAHVFRSAWRLVGTLPDLARPGDYLTADLSGTPVIVRNFDGRIQALSNVCAHRHCLIRSEPSGCSPVLKCQYHGWEYQETGLSSRMPGAQYFHPITERPRLPLYRTALCGQLVFVNLEDEGPSLEAFLGPMFAELRQRFGESWRQTLAKDIQITANWKVAVENSLEAYHIPQVHPETFRTDPGEERSTHRLEASFTDFFVVPPFDNLSRMGSFLSDVEVAMLHGLKETSTPSYRHVHIFPNLLFSYTDMISLVQVIEPTGPQSSRSLIRQFGLYRDRWPAWGRIVMSAWIGFQANLTWRILNEDADIMAAIQGGLRASRQDGMLGRCEERLHAFQQWLLDQTPGGDLNKDSR